MTDKTYWQIDTAKLTAEILQQSRKAGTEEDLKMAVEPILRRAFKSIGVDVNIVEYEKRTALTAKRMDAVYGYVELWNMKR